MLRRIERFVACLVVAPLLAFTSGIAPAHAHEAHGERPQAVVHSHLALHHVDSHDHDDAEIEHPDEAVVWLDDAFVHQSHYQSFGLTLAVTPVFDNIFIAPAWAIHPRDGAPPAHGPPRLYAPDRAPPSHLA